MRQPKTADSVDIPEGFTLTELGLLPEEWRVVRLGEVFDIQQGKALSRKKDKGIRPRPFLRTANVFWGHVDLSHLDYMDFSEAEEHKYHLQTGDLLVCEGGDVGRTAIWEGQARGVYYQNHLHRLRANVPEAEPWFFMYWMQAAITLLNLYLGTSNKTTIPNLSRSRLANFLLPLPPLPEQRAIAQVLRTVQRAKEATERVIAAARELKKSLMCHLFIYGPVPLDQAGQVALKETEIGPVPERWKITQLGEVLQYTQYGLSVRAGQSGAYPMLRMNNLVNGQIDTADLKYVDLSATDFTKFRLNKQDVLFNRTNSYDLVGKTAIFDIEGDFVFASYLIRVVPDTTRLVSEYLNYYFNCDATQRRLKTLATRGVSQSNISATKLNRLVIALPPLDDQREIARILQTVDRKIAAEEQRKEALDALFKTLLYHLMTGKVRVKFREGTDGFSLGYREGD